MKRRRARKDWIYNKNTWKTLIVPGGLILAIFILGRIVDLQSYFETAQQWSWRLGAWGPVAFGALYIVAMLFLLPGTPFTILAALLFGTLWGYVTMLSATTIAATVAFFMSRYVAKDRLEKQLSGLDDYHKVRRWVETNHWLAIPFLRVMPMFPFAINNYVLGLTNIPFWIYMIASMAIFVPMTGVMIFGAQSLYRAMVAGEVAWGMIGGAVAAGLVILLLGMTGKKVFMRDDQGQAEQ
ncbi:hypothetical protein Tel_04295 [Candidatus Tenderia electrophaga]|jgi:uncharacterized membrane protein YdjX (TVP38/TMEM64 family)|uniref:TVP38/TMEM64 family membrane protein n=1 Tax=Candidatus Tenderia electrophaga TaxID=1748243 RepID=A0A0S2TB87_9GAMM|nr:hypothetical protein Tel_04295 [Candidatus Tenderia electrophaga]